MVYFFHCTVLVSGDVKQRLNGIRKLDKKLETEEDLLNFQEKFKQEMIPSLKGMYPDASIEEIEVKIDSLNPL